MKVAMRQNQRALSDTDRDKFVNAVRALKDNGTYDQYVRIHLDYQAAGHRGPAFLAWHREYLRRFEADLQVAAKDPLLGLPYWDWSLDSSPSASIWSSGFMGGDGQPSDGQVIRGPFAFKTGRWTLNVRTDEEPTTYLRRKFGTDPDVPSLPTPDDVQQTLSATPYDVDPWDDTSGSGFRNTLEGFIPGSVPQMHNRVHAWVGGSMVPVTSPNDPVFWLHHCYIDKLWADWQAMHPDESYVPDAGAAPGHNLTDPMPPWTASDDSVTPENVWDHRALGYRYDTENYLLAGEELHPFQTISSANGNLMLWYDNLGRLSLKILNGPTLWTSGPGATNPPSPACVMEANGNLVSYDSSGRIIWQSGTRAHPDGFLTVLDEGSIALFEPNASEPYWSEPKG